MDNYPEVVATIANDYLERLKAQLTLAPAREQQEFLREIQSHIFEAYQQAPPTDDVARILAVLRKLGEPAEVVSDRLPAAMVRSGATRSVPLHVLGGILIALFGIPLGFGGAAVLAGVLIALSVVVVTYYAAMGMMFVAAAALIALGLVRMYASGLWERLLAAGVIHIDWKLDQILRELSPEAQGLLVIAVASVFLASGLAMLWGGRYMIRGLRFLYSLAFDCLRQLAEAVRRKLRHARVDGFGAARVPVAE